MRNFERTLFVKMLSLAAVAAASVVACSTTDAETPTDDGGTPVQDEAGPVGTDGGPGVDGATKDGAVPAVPCSRLTTLCKDGEKCDGSPDCVSKVCFNNVCKAAAPADGVKNGDETDIDCGGSKAPACADGKGCLVKGDCTSGVCTNKICQAPTSTDGVQNGNETGVDCGGTSTNAPKCGAGMGCLTNADCDKLKCDTATKKCLVASHSDGVMNLDETGIDCGGPTVAVARCAPGQGCVDDGDCANTRCNAGKTCDPATSTDGLKNGTETDIDCGGLAPTNAPGCAVGLTCAIDGDCGSKACNYAFKCVESVSCKTQHGGDTCGPMGNESCCKSLPAGAVNLDKYNITAGRFRQFVASLGAGGNMRAWLMANTPAGWPANWTNMLPTMLDNGGTNPDFTGIYQELGPNVHPPGAVGANEGCFIDGFGARTYRLPDAINTRMSDPQYYSQALLDDRPLNCVPVPMLAAFCAWDGGKLATKEQIDVAWGAGKYPWGDAPAPLGYHYAIGTDPMGGSEGSYQPFQAAPYVAPPLPAANLALANYNYNYWGGDVKADPPGVEDYSGKSCAMLPGHAVGTCPWRDYSIFLARPGRFPTGNSATGHADLAGNVFNGVHPTATDAASYTNGTNAHWSRSGSWQGHTIPWSAKGSWLGVSASNKYWAMGGRCIH